MNMVLWAIDNEISDKDFERLCCDLLYREGYTSLIPIGGVHDRGRDAESHQASNTATFFQFSLEKNWENKLRQELRKVQRNQHQIDTFVYITRGRVTGNKRDSLSAFAKREYGWNLIVYDREWLRHRLEEVYPDLAMKYLGIQATPQRLLSTHDMKPSISPSDHHLRAWQLYAENDYEAAAVELRSLVEQDKDSPKVLQALAWSQYCLFRYSEALQTINTALDRDPSNKVSLALKACILTEDGIKRGTRANLILGRNIFGRLAQESRAWVDHYNYANALNALGEYELAKDEFRAALDYNPNIAEIWKNLGSVYYHLHEHEEELKCYDQALAINPTLPEALMSKGVTLLQALNRPEEAIDFISSALRVPNSFTANWPHAWYWLGLALYRVSKLREALDKVNTGLLQAPDHAALLQLKATLLSALWRDNPDLIDEAQSFFEFRLELLGDSDYTSLCELAELYRATNQSELQWKALGQFLGQDINKLQQYLAIADVDPDQYIELLAHLPLYQSFRSTIPCQRYMSMLVNGNLRCDDDLADALYIACLVPFVQHYLALKALSPSQREKQLVKYRSELLSQLGDLLPKLSITLVPCLDQSSKEEIIDGLSSALTIWPDIALLEFSAQAGFIGGNIGISQRKLLKSLDALELNKWQVNIIASSLSKLNSQLHLLKD